MANRETILANSNILAEEVHNALQTINLMAKMLYTLKPLQIVECYVYTALEAKRQEYDSWVDLRDAMRKDLWMLNYEIFNSGLSDIMVEDTFDEICQIAYREYFL